MEVPEIRSLNVRTFSSQFYSLFGAALILVASLAWNTALQSIFTRIFGVQNQIWGQLFYAVTVTIIVIVVLYLLHFIA